MTNAIELIPIVDKNNVVIGIKDRTTAHKEGLYHKSVNVMIFNSEGEILLQKRSANKEAYPLHWDCVSEHLRPDESYLDAAIRGVQEELGIRKIIPAKIRDLHFQHYQYNGLTNNEFCELYKIVYDGELTINSAEVEEADFYPISFVAELDAKEKLVPWFRNEWVWLKENGPI